MNMIVCFQICTCTILTLQWCRTLRFISGQPSPGKIHYPPPKHSRRNLWETKFILYTTKNKVEVVLSILLPLLDMFLQTLFLLFILVKWIASLMWTCWPDHLKKIAFFQETFFNHLNVCKKLSVNHLTAVISYLHILIHITDSH